MCSNFDVIIRQNHFAGVALFLARGEYFLDKPRRSSNCHQKPKSGSFQMTRGICGLSFTNIFFTQCLLTASNLLEGLEQDSEAVMLREGVPKDL